MDNRECHGSFMQEFKILLENLDFFIDEDMSTEACLYARDCDSKVGYMLARLTLIATPNNSARDEYMFEISSSETLLKSGLALRD